MCARCFGMRAHAYVLLIHNEYSDSELYAIASHLRSAERADVAAVVCKLHDGACNRHCCLWHHVYCTGNARIFCTGTLNPCPLPS